MATSISARIKVHNTARDLRLLAYHLETPGIYGTTGLSSLGLKANTAIQLHKGTAYELHERVRILHLWISTAKRYLTVTIVGDWDDTKGTTDGWFWTNVEHVGYAPPKTRLATIGQLVVAYLTTDTGFENQIASLSQTRDTGIAPRLLGLFSTREGVSYCEAQPGDEGVFQMAPAGGVLYIDLRDGETISALTNSFAKVLGAKFLQEGDTRVIRIEGTTASLENFKTLYPTLKIDAEARELRGTAIGAIQSFRKLDAAIEEENELLALSHKARRPVFV